MIKQHFNKLRKKLTVLPACIASIVVMSICVTSYQIVKSQYISERNALFENGVTSVQNQWNTYNLVDSRWLSEAEASYGFLISLEENGKPLSFSLLNSSKQILVSEVKMFAKENYGIYTHLAPISGHTRSNTVFELNFEKREYRCVVKTFSATSGWRTIIALQDMELENVYLLRITLIFLGLSVVAIVTMIYLCWYFIGKALEPVLEIYQQQDEFIASASHELRTPLTVLKTGFSALKSNPDKSSRYIDLMDKEIDKMNKLVGDLLLLAGGKYTKWRLEKSLVEIDVLIMEVVEKLQIAASKTNHNLILDLREDCFPEIMVDKFRIEQVITVLINNSCRFTSPGDKITVGVKLQAKWVVISVSDNGPGIKNEYKTKIFDKFFQIKDIDRPNESHYGLGLAVAKELVLMHDGQIEVVDTPNGGATFLVKLPK